MPTSVNDGPEAPLAPAAETRRRATPMQKSAALARHMLRKAGVILQSGRLTGRGAIVIAVVLLAVLLILHAKSDDSNVRRASDIVAQLATLKLIDARWDVAVMRARSETNLEPVVQTRDVNRMQRALDLAATEARSNATRTVIAELKSAYAEKAELVGRFQRASADSRQALEAAMRADTAVSNLVRSAWRDFPQRDRLVAAESLVARVLAEAQQYHHTPTATRREALEAFAADLPRATSLPPPVLAGLERLESDVHQLLLLKPLEHMLGERLNVLNTAARADELAETYQRDLNDALQQRERYRLALLIYSAALLLAACYLGTRAWQRYHALEKRYVALASARVDPQSTADGAAEAEPADANITYFRRP